MEDAAAKEGDVELRGRRPGGVDVGWIRAGGYRKGRGEGGGRGGEGRGGEVDEGAVGTGMAAGSGVVASMGFMGAVPPCLSVFALMCG